MPKLPSQLNAPLPGIHEGVLPCVGLAGVAFDPELVEGLDPEPVEVSGDDNGSGADHERKLNHVESVPFLAVNRMNMTMIVAVTNVQ